MPLKPLLLVALSLAALAAPPTSADTVSSHDLTVTVDPAAGTVVGQGVLDIATPGRIVTLLLGADYTLAEAAWLDASGTPGRSLTLKQPVPVSAGAAGDGGAPQRAWRFKGPRGKPATARLAVKWVGKPPGLPKDMLSNRNEVTDVPRGYLASEGAWLPPSAAWYPTGGQVVSLFKLAAAVPGRWRVISEGRLVLPADAGTGAAPSSDATANASPPADASPSASPPSDANPSASPPTDANPAAPPTPPTPTPPPAIRTETYVVEHPLEAIDLVAAPWTVLEETVNGVRCAVYSLPTTPREMSNDYLFAVVDAIARFAQQIGAYPWPQFAVAEHILPTGLGMPSFTLLGSDVMRLPFIVKTSLPHEVLHDWWGNGVYVNYAQGNWSEGLTAYLADHESAGMDTPGGSRDYRRQILRDYAEYVTRVGGVPDAPLSQFRERHDRATRAIGYGKSAMLFHMLRVKLGDETFFAGLRRFYQDNLYRRAGWTDLENAFSQAARVDLRPFFRQWIESPGAPSLAIGDVAVREEGGEWITTVKLTAEDRWLLDVPVEVRGSEPIGVRAVAGVSQGSGEVRVRTRFKPQSVAVDPDVDVFRRLDPAELPPTFARLFAAPLDLIVLGSRRGATFQNAARQLGGVVGEGKTPVRAERDVTDQMLKDAARVLVIGTPSETFMARVPALPKGVAFENDREVAGGKSADDPRATLVVVIDHHGDGSGALGILDSLSFGDLEGTSNRIRHYGKYSFVLFGEGNPVAKGTFPAPGEPLIRAIP